MSKPSIHMGEGLKESSVAEVSEYLTAYCPAFPVSYEHPAGRFDSLGMSLRDWFAGQALAGLLSDPEIGGIASTVEYAYKCADAMLKERGK